jgi:hypothetical protein
MLVEANVTLVRSLLQQIPLHRAVELSDFSQPQADVLFGLRELIMLGLIDGDFSYGEDSDPSGPFLTSASKIRLTKLGRNFV